MRSPLLPFALALVVTLLIGIGVSMEPYFAGDVRAARALQSLSPEPGWWATPISGIPTAPVKYYVMAIAMVLAYMLAGWRGLALTVAAILLDQYGGEASKSIFGRPRPSPDLIKVAGTPRGFTFPSTTLTFACATFGVLALLSLQAKAGSHGRRALPAKAGSDGRLKAMRAAVLVISVALIALSCAARVALGAHWPSDVLLTTVVCMTWLWAANRACFA